MERDGTELRVGDTAVRFPYLVRSDDTLRVRLAYKFFPPVHYIRLEVSTTFIPTIQHLLTVPVAHQLAH